MEDKVIEEIVDLYDSAKEEFKTTKDTEYWQGRKDGLRLALALLQPEERIWNMLNHSSHGFRIEEREQYKNFISDIYYDVCDLIYSIRHKEKLNGMTISNIQNWIGTYMQEEHKNSGFVKPSPDAINPFSK
jgi:hypothetical protein